MGSFFSCFFRVVLIQTVSFLVIITSSLNYLYLVISPLKVWLSYFLLVFENCFQLFPVLLAYISWNLLSKSADKLILMFIFGLNANHRSWSIYWRAFRWALLWKTDCYLNCSTDSMWAIDMIVNLVWEWVVVVSIQQNRNAAETTLCIPPVGVLLKILLVYMHNSFKANGYMEKFNTIPVLANMFATEALHWIEIDYFNNLLVSRYEMLEKHSFIDHWFCQCENIITIFENFFKCCDVTRYM